NIRIRIVPGLTPANHSGLRRYSQERITISGNRFTDREVANLRDVQCGRFGRLRRLLCETHQQACSFLHNDGMHNCEFFCAPLKTPAATRIEPALMSWRSM